MYYNNIEFNDFVQVHRVKVWLKKSLEDDCKCTRIL